MSMNRVNWGPAIFAIPPFWVQTTYQTIPINIIFLLENFSWARLVNRAATPIKSFAQVAPKMVFIYT